MLKKFFVFFVSALAIFASFFYNISPASAQAARVLVGEGGFDAGGLQAMAADANAYCKEGGGAVKLDIAKNNLRIEIDEEGNMAAGYGELELDFSQNCPGEPVAKLIKSAGKITGQVALTGSYYSGKAQGFAKVSLSLPTLVSFSTSLNNVPWEATHEAGFLRGSLSVNLDQFGFSADVPFRLKTRMGDAKFLSTIPKEMAQFKRDLSAAMSEVNSWNFVTRWDGVYKLRNIKRDLPLDRRPWNEIDPLPEIEALMDLFDGYILCVQRNVDQQSGGNDQWKECFFTAGEILERTDGYVRLISPPSLAAPFYLQLAAQWDRFRYFALYNPENVRYDKVETCERAKSMARKAAYLDRANAGTAEAFLAQLSGKGGCDGMPLFGENREEMEQKMQEALDAARQAAVEGNLEGGGEGEETREEFVGGLEEAIEENSTPQSEEERNEGAKNLEQSLQKSSTALSEAKDAIAELKASDPVFRDMTDKELTDLLSRTADAGTKTSIQDACRILRDYSERVRDAVQTGQDVKEVYGLIKSGEELGSYGGLSLFGDAVATYADYTDLKEKGCSSEDALFKATMDNFGASAINLFPPAKAVDTIFNAPDRVLRVFGVSEDGWARKYGTGLLAKASPSGNIKTATEIVAFKTKTWGEIGDTFVEAGRQIKDAKGVFGTSVAIARGGAVVIGGTVVSAVQATRNVWQGASQISSKIVGWFR